jgi:sigma-B regulation protein RsbU (phosphoserine phosphatase)
METRAAGQDIAQVSAPRATVLVVASDLGLKLLVSQKFRREIRENELAFVFAEDGGSALKTLGRNDVDVVVTDVQLPGADGLTLLFDLKKYFPNIRSVIISAYGDMRTIRRALNLGAFDFLTKPIDLDDLGVTILKTVEESLTLKHAVRDRERLTAIRQELDVARRIQLSMIPRTFPAFPERNEFDIYGDIKTARDVGGDFYDFCILEGDRLYFAISDASGKGVPAALFMAVTRTMIKADAVKGHSPEKCLSETNKILCMENEFSMFITAFCGILDIGTGEVTYSNGGHKLPLLLRAGSEIETLQNTDGIALGVLEGDSLYGLGRMKLGHGDTIFLYSDGVTEAVNRELELYTDKRLANVLSAVGPGLPKDAVEAVLGAVEIFSEGVSQTDDMALLAIRYN